MRKKIIASEKNKKAIGKALKEHKALKQAKRVLKDYKGKNFKILKIKSLIDERI